MKPTLFIFTKAPRIGLSKTRLAADIGPVRAWQVKRTLDAFTCRAAQGNAWTTKLAVSPDRDLKTHFKDVWPADLTRVSQGKGNLGQRMAAVLQANSRGAVCIIGSDLPDLQTKDIGEAFKALKRNDVVIGPTTDGGYWLIAMSARCARRVKLDHVRWSSVHTLSDTLECLPTTWRVGFLRELEDVDDGASLRRLKMTNSTRSTERLLL